MTHNGWTNYETWVVKLRMDDSESLQRYYRELAKSKSTAADIAKVIKDEHMNASPTRKSDVYSDLLQSALNRVDWHEIAQALREEYNYEGDDEDE